MKRNNNKLIGFAEHRIAWLSEETLARLARSREACDGSHAAAEASGSGVAETRASAPAEAGESGVAETRASAPAEAGESGVAETRASAPAEASGSDVAETCASAPAEASGSDVAETRAPAPAEAGKSGAAESCALAPAAACKSAAAAVRRLVAEADEWLEHAALTVTSKRETPPSLDKRDYMSLSIYHWPNPATPDGLPYIRRDGEVNPETERYDRPALAGLHDAVEALALAYAVTGAEKYAAKAIAFLDAWFVDADTRMNPNMLYAQYIPGHGGFDTPDRYPAVYVPGAEGRGIHVAFGGMIEGARLAPVINLLPLLEPSPHWTPSVSDGIKRWCRQFLHWMLHHQHGKDEAGCLNNHGSWYCVQALAHALYSGETETARHIAEVRVPERIAMQIEPDGSMPEELGRANAFHYVVFGLMSFCNLALMAEKVNVNLWQYATPDGRGIRRALDWLVPYLEEPGAWPGQAAKPPEGQLIGAVPLLYMGWRAYGDERYRRVLRQLRTYPDDHRNRLLFDHE